MRPKTLKQVACKSPQSNRRGTKKYVLRQGTTETFAKLTVDSKIDLETLENYKSSEMGMNEIGSATLKLAKPILNDEYTYINKLGALVLIDPITHQTSAALMIKG